MTNVTYLGSLDRRGSAICREALTLLCSSLAKTGYLQEQIKHYEEKGVSWPLATLGAAKSVALKESDARIFGMMLTLLETGVIVGALLRDAATHDPDFMRLVERALLRIQDLKREC